jgi:hypothetical protein
MSLGEDVLQPARLLDAPLAASGATAGLHRLPVYVACTLSVLVANYLLGKDMAWDMLNYHLYAGFSAVNDRFAQDYFAAGAPSYFNPYAYVPFYAMVSLGLPALVIGSLLAAAHSIMLWLTYELAVVVCPFTDRRIKFIFCVCAVALAFANPILIQEIGSSFADVTTAELALAGWLLLAGAVRAPTTARVVCAGLLLGAATALKPTNSVHAIAAVAILLFLPSLRDRIRQGISYAICLGLGFAMVAAPWSYRLERTFGNPVFPLMNGIFRSSEFTTEPLRHFRYIPANLAEALWRPFAIVDPVRLVHEELSAPDLRYAVLAVLICWLLLRWLWTRFSRSSIPPMEPGSAVAMRTLTALGCGLGADWVLWLAGSGNGRYFLPMACVTAVVVITLVFRIFATRAKVRNYTLVALFAVQAVQLSMGAQLRWNAVPWDGQWLSIAAPIKLTAESNLYLTIGAQSNSFIAAFLAKGSGLVNFSGGYALGPEGANGARIEALIRRYTPHLRVLWRGEPLAEDERRLALLDDALARFGLRVDAGDCAAITVRDMPREVKIEFKAAEPVAPRVQQPSNANTLMSCRIVPDGSDRSATIARQRAVDLVFDHLEDACPELFQPRHLRTEQYSGYWRRLYMNTDLVATVSHGSVMFLNPLRGGPTVNLGRESNWAKAPLPLACGRHNGRYFATVLEAKEGP